MKSINLERPFRRLTGSFFAADGNRRSGSDAKLLQKRSGFADDALRLREIGFGFLAAVVKKSRRYASVLPCFCLIKSA